MTFKGSFFLRATTTTTTKMAMTAIPPRMPTRIAILAELLSPEEEGEGAMTIDEATDAEEML